MYCIPFSFKDPYEVKDMRSTGGADARYDMDFPARDHTLVAQLRQKGAIIYAKANTTEYNGRGPGDPGGRNHPTKVLPSTLGYQRSTWAGNPCNSYDTDARRIDRVELGIGRLGQHEPRHVQPVRGDGAVVPRPGQSQFGGAHPAAQGASVVSRAARSARKSTTTAPASTAAPSPTP